MQDPPTKKSKLKRKRTKNVNSTDDGNSEVLAEQMIDEIPKKKSKKNKPINAQPGTTDSKISKRQLKRERHAQRLLEAETASHKSVQTQALSYLSLWKHNRAEWKFNKVKQIWLHKHKFDEDKIPEELWQPFIEYFAAASGSIKQLLIADSNKIIQEMENSIEKNEDTSDAQPSKPAGAAYQRARDILQNIQE